MSIASISLAVVSLVVAVIVAFINFGRFCYDIGKDVQRKQNDKN